MIRAFVVTCAALLALSISPPDAAAQGSAAAAQRSEGKEAKFAKLEQARHARVAAFVQAGKNKDRSQIPVLVKVLRSREKDEERLGNDRLTEMDFMAALHALAQMNAVEALPDIEQAPSSLPIGKFAATLVAARIRAQEAARNYPGTAQGRAHTKISVFLDNLDMDVATINAALEERHKQERLRRVPYQSVSSGEVAVLREVADMIYQDRDLELAEAARRRGLRFDLDTGAAQKMALVPLSQAERVRKLIDTLSQLEAIQYETKFTIKLAINEGVAASRAAAAKLLQMKAERNKYPRPGGISALFDVIGGVGNSEQAAVVEGFLGDQEKWVIYHAKRILPGLKQGIAWPYMLSY